MAHVPFVLRKLNKDDIIVDSSKNHSKRNDIIMELSRNDFFQIVYEHYEHIGNKLLEFAGNPAFDQYINLLISDTRDGTRKGFPDDVGSAILKLSRIHDEIILKYSK